MSLTYWPELLLFMAAVLLVALYGLTVSGHFPIEHRAERLKSASGATLMWGTMTAAAIAGLIAVAFAWRLIPWYAAVIGGGGMLLFAPLLLQPLPDSFVNGRRGLVAFAGASALLAIAMWRIAG
ncbi:MAG: hypothetical protein KJZ80_11795 [Hyphomicrobiaceae bacterium]|nr:hypothetical protein [Hyphomicrobiaceae bacterium]